MTYDEEINTYRLQISAPRELLHLSTGKEFVKLDLLKQKLDAIKESGLQCLYTVAKQTDYIENGWCKHTSIEELDEFYIEEKPESTFKWGQQEDDDKLIIF